MAGNDKDSLDDYLSEVADLPLETGGDNGGNNDQQQEQQQRERPNETSTNEVDELNGRSSSPTQQQERTPETQQRQPQQNAQPANQGAVPEGLRRYHLGNFLNAQGDIVNEKGEIIAQRGSQRRLHDENHRLQSENRSYTQELQQLRRQTQETNFLNGVPRQYGLSNDEVAHGLDLEARIKRGDVVGVAREVTAMLASKGVNVSAILGKDVGDSVDMAAIRAMLDDRLRPLQQQEQQSQQQQERLQQARSQYEAFVRDNEYADVQADVIVAYKQKHNVSLQQAYNATRSFAVANGFDMSQPLGPQIEALQQQQQQQRLPDPRRPMPNGASTRVNDVSPMRPAYADADDSWSSIISRALDSGSVN